MFAQSPAAFADSGDIYSVTFPSFYRRLWSVTNRGLAIDLDVRKQMSVPLLELAPLHCARSRDKETPICIRLCRQSRDDLVRWGLGEVVVGKGSLAGDLQDEAYEHRTVYIRQVCNLTVPHASISTSNPEIQSFVISPSLRENGFWLSGIYRSDMNLSLWDEHSATINLGQGFGALLARNETGEDFLLILRALRDFSSIDVLIQKHDKKWKNFVGFLRPHLYGQPDS